MSDDTPQKDPTADWADLFYCSIKSCVMHTDTGKPIIFVNGKYFTKDRSISRYLDGQIEAGSAVLSRDPAQLRLDPELMDPMKALESKIRAQIIAEHAAEAARSQDPNRALGISELQKLIPASTTSIAAVAAGSGPISKK